ncbi:DUF2897 family protein [Shewanella gaetbuli]|uniref:DUF2897 family protein n=1 Tax=Shewanella gaetbuli TaxID=220752 RepID=A0A9X2CLY1_9GAMM|nr:DUF2897 family protein [Shewanella gaetbuli]MCL1143164.1 DUF2897 family protein [Shewanella gaetbuli]
MDLSGFEVWIIIILVVGVIASNLAVLKYSAKFKMPHLGDHKDKSIGAEETDSTEAKKADSGSDSNAGTDTK